LAQSTQTGPQHPLPRLAAVLRGQRKSGVRLRIPVLLTAPLLLLLAGCGAGGVSANSTAFRFSLSPGFASIDTNCTGCNATNALGRSVQKFTPTLPGGVGTVTWSLAGGDPVSGPGTISSTGEYIPPSYLTADRVEVVVTANLKPAVTASTALTLTPGFMQPLTPQNVALGANGQATITGYLAEAGGTTGINFALSNSPGGATGGLGTLSTPSCQRGTQAFTWCRVTYTAPATVPSTSATFIVATAGASASRTVSEVLVNAVGVSSNPTAHQAQMPVEVLLGSSGGNNIDYDAQGNQIVDCCSGTLGALIADGAGRQYLLSNNHVLAKSDQAGVGDAIVQPGLIDNNCTPNGDGPGTTPVASLTGWLALNSSATNADAAIAQVASRAVDPSGSILELGVRQQDGTLAAAPPGISSSGGKGEAAWLSQPVAKSGRTTGLTCANVSALDVDVHVDYYLDCAETRRYLTKIYTGQVAVSGNSFSDSGDSGALVVDAANAEPVGLYFAGGIDADGVSQAMANPVAEVLSELSAQVGGGASYRFVGAADHQVSCLNYGNNTVSAAQGRTLADAEIARAQQALAAARALINPAAGILGVSTGKSNDAAGESAVLIFVDENMTVSVPATVGGVRTQMIPTTAHAVAFGSAPQSASISTAPPLTAAALGPALAVKKQIAISMMQNPAFFAVGVAQSLDNPREAALVVYVDRNRVPADLPQTIGGLRARYVVMDRLHVTRAYAAPLTAGKHCMAHPLARPALGSTKPL